MAGTQDQEGLLRGRMANILLSRPCARINFAIDNVAVDGSMLSYVGLALSSPAAGGRGFPIVVDPNGTSRANYTPPTNTFMLPHLGYAAGGPMFDFERQTIVHEATHAAIDALDPRDEVVQITNEMCGYVAGALYLEFYSDLAPLTDAKPATRQTYVAARKLARDIAATVRSLNYAGRVNITAASLAPLRSAILDSATYADIKADEGLRSGNDGVVL